MTDSTPTSPEIAFEWWRRLTQPEGPARGQRRASLASMRRAATPIEVMQEPDALRLIGRLPNHPDRIATLAGVLAHVREMDGRPVARAIGRNSLDDDRSALVSETRFRRLLQAHDDELMGSMRRLVRMMKGKVNVPDLAAAILYWGDRTKRRWIFDYYGVSGSGSPSPGEHDNDMKTAKDAIDV